VASLGGRGRAAPSRYPGRRAPARGVPHQLRRAHAHALELLREGVPLNVVQRQLGHRNLGVTSIYLQGIDPDEIIQPSTRVDRR
jgi:integrase/recombinase XerD